MKKLNEIVYNKLLLQAKEAQERDMDKLASGILNSLTPIPEDENINYNFIQLKEDIYQGLWKLATCVIKYHDVNSVNAEKVNDTIESLAYKMINEIEQSLDVDNASIGPLESKLPGEIK